MTTTVKNKIQGKLNEYKIPINMETIKINVSNITIEEKIIRLPAWTKGGCRYYCITNPEECIEVCIGGLISEVSIKIVSPSLAFSSGEKECSEMDFEMAMKQAWDKMNLILNPVTA